MATVKVTFKTKNGTVVKEKYWSFQRPQTALENLRDFPATVADIAGGGEGKPINGIEATARNKFTMSGLWRNFSEEAWEFTKTQGKFYVEIEPVSL